jgi:hypothetical protein
MGAYMTVNMGVTPIGNLATGAIAGAFGAPAAMAIGAAAGLAFVLGGSTWLFTNRDRTDLSLVLLSDLDIELPSARRERAVVA